MNSVYLNEFHAFFESDTIDEVSFTQIVQITGEQLIEHNIVPSVQQQSLNDLHPMRNEVILNVGKVARNHSEHLLSLAFVDVGDFVCAGVDGSDEGQRFHYHLLKLCVCSTMSQIS